MTDNPTRLTRSLFLASALAALVGGAAAATAPAAASPEQVVRNCIADFNKGDMKAATAAFAADSSVIDEFAPYEWHGPDALNTWLSAFGDWAKARGRVDNIVKVTSVVRSETDGDSAYVVVRELYTYKEKHRRMSENGVADWTLHKDTDGWKITGTAWGSPRGTAMAAAAKPASPAAAPAAPAKKP